MPPMNAARRRALQAVLSAIAGGGLTAAGLGGPLAGAALASETTTTPATTETTTTPAPTPTETTPAPPPPTTTTTPETTASTPPATTPATSAPATTTPTTPTTPTTTSAPAPPKPAGKPTETPKVVLKRRQRSTSGVTKTESTTAATTKAAKEAAGANNVALSPQAIAAQASALASTEASIQALGFYRIPLFLLPIYKSAAIQYGVPWQILAAINEIETDYGTDLSISSAGAVGWMQFMPATWLQYGVDALNAGYADPYNPVDAIFAAARYLRAAGASTNLPAAILAYNHSAEYVSSVLLRAKLISAYPRSVIATLTGLVDGRLPVTGHVISWSAPPVLPPAASATAGAAPVPSSPTPANPVPPSGAPTSPAPAPAAAAASTSRKRPLELVTLTSAADAKVVAVQNGKIVQIGSSRELGRFLVLRDVYGDVFTYGGLGDVAASYLPPKPHRSSAVSPLVQAASQQDPAPSKAASAGFQSPLTLPAPATHHGHAPAATAKVSVPDTEAVVAGSGKVRLFAHPGNPDARAAASAAAAARTRQKHSSARLPLRVGSVVPTGTVLGRVTTAPGAAHGHLRFAIRPSGDSSTIDPRAVLANWAQLQSALHTQGAKAEDALLGATASDVFLLSKSQLERTVLSDPGIVVYACGRHDVATGKIDKRVLAVLAFLSRSGLDPTVTGLRCGEGAVTSAGAPSAAYRGDAVLISAINGTPIASHQGAGTVADVTIRTLLTLPSEFLPATILSLMRYPGVPSTHASSAYWNRLRLAFNPPVTGALALAPATIRAAGTHGRAKAAKLAAVPLIQESALSSNQWDQLVTRIGGLPVPTVARKPSSAAIPDHPNHR